MNYKQRNIIELDMLGGHYFRHVHAMIKECLHSKSAIAGELAYRDCKIAMLEAKVAKLQGLIQNGETVTFESIAREQIQISYDIESTEIDDILTMPTEPPAEDDN